MSNRTMNRSLALSAGIGLLLSGCGQVQITVHAPPTPPAAQPYKAVPPVSAQARVKIIEFAAPLALPDGVDHSTTSYIRDNIALIESRPFDGMVINNFTGRNFMGAHFAQYPWVVDSTGALSYEGAMGDFTPIRGVFHKFTDNFAKVHFLLGASATPPLLNDDAGWAIVYRSAENYARAVHDSGLKGIFFNNEQAERIPIPPDGHPGDYYWPDDQRALEGNGITDEQLLALAVQRGREFMQALQRGYPDITVITEHGAATSCSSWATSTGYYGYDYYLLGAYAAGMIDAVAGSARVIDSEALYGPSIDFATYKGFINGTSAQSVMQCPFMSPAMAATWKAKLTGVAFQAWDKQRPSMTASYALATPVTPAQFEPVMAAAYAASDQYMWSYSQVIDWWGTTTEAQLPPWITAINEVVR